MNRQPISAINVNICTNDIHFINLFIKYQSIRMHIDRGNVAASELTSSSSEHAECSVLIRSITAVPLPITQ